MISQPKQTVFGRGIRLLMILALIFNGLGIDESIESNEPSKESTEQTTELAEKEAVCQKKLSVFRSVFLAGNLPHHDVLCASACAYCVICSPTNPRPILHRSLRI